MSDLAEDYFRIRRARHADGHEAYCPDCGWSFELVPNNFDYADAIAKATRHLNVAHWGRIDDTRTAISFA